MAWQGVARSLVLFVTSLVLALFAGLALEAFGVEARGRRRRGGGGGEGGVGGGAGGGGWRAVRISGVRPIRLAVVYLMIAKGLALVVLGLAVVGRRSSAFRKRRRTGLSRA